MDGIDKILSPGRGEYVNKKGQKLFKYILKLGIIFLLTSLAILVAEQFFTFSLKDGFVIAGVVYIFIGGSNTFGDMGRRADFQYLYARSMSFKSQTDEIRRDKNELDQNSSSVIEIILVGILLMIIGFTIFK